MTEQSAQVTTHTAATHRCIRSRRLTVHTETRPIQNCTWYRSAIEKARGAKCAKSTKGWKISELLPGCGLPNPMDGFQNG